VLQLSVKMNCNGQAAQQSNAIKDLKQLSGTHSTRGTPLFIRSAASPDALCPAW
jgi:hypothetical protein